MVLTRSELLKLGLGKVGKDVSISDKCSIYGNPADISIGDNVRVDDFCILSGKITLGNNIHIAAYAAIFGRYGVVMEDRTGISARVIIFSATSDWSGKYLTNPMNPEEFINTEKGPVIMKKFSLVGAGTIIMPGVTLNEGAAIGSMSLVKKSIPGWEIWAGIPAKFIKKREKELVKLAKQLDNV